MGSKGNSTFDAVASVPPTGVAALSFAGVGLSDWVLIATLAWLAMQMGWFAWKRFREWQSTDGE